MAALHFIASSSSISNKVEVAIAGSGIVMCCPACMRRVASTLLDTCFARAVLLLILGSEHFVLLRIQIDSCKQSAGAGRLPARPLAWKYH